MCVLQIGLNDTRLRPHTAPLSSYVPPNTVVWLGSFALCCAHVGRPNMPVDLLIVGTPRRKIVVFSNTHTFQATSSGVFMERRGAGWNAERHCSHKKLCFVATDQGLLARVLGELADRPDCYYVKYSIEPRDGHVLGSVPLATRPRGRHSLARVQKAPQDDVHHPGRRLYSYVSAGSQTALMGTGSSDVK